VEIAEQLMSLNPILNPLEGWGTSECKLGGNWKKLFTTAADATFKPGRRGNAKVFRDTSLIRKRLLLQ